MARSLPAPDSTTTDLTVYDPGPEPDTDNDAAEPDLGAFAEAAEAAFVNLDDKTYDFPARLKNCQLKTAIDKDGILTVEVTLVIATNPQGVKEAMRPLLDLIADTNPGSRLAVSIRPATTQRKLPL